MSAFILPVTIESRKILFLGLDPKLPSNINDMDPGEDEFIVEGPQLHNSVTVLSLSKRKVIQTLHKKVSGDLNIDAGNIQLEYEEASNTFVISLCFDNAETGAKGEISEKSVWLSQGLEVSLSDDEDLVKLELSRSDHFDNKQVKNQFFVRFNLYCAQLEDGSSFTALLKFYIASLKQIMLLGLDFGSEASQMIEGRYDGVINTSPVKATVDIFSILRRSSEYANDNTAEENFIQYESPSLYKSVFYAPKRVSISFQLDEDQQAKCVQIIPGINNITPLGLLHNKFYQKWIQVPNLKLIHDNSGVCQDFRFIVDEGGVERERFLNDLKSGIYASLLQSIIVGSLKARVSRPVYLRFTLLVPNIYTIEEIKATKKIIRQIILDEGSDLCELIKGVEISSISESDAAFLGYMHNLNSNPGDYFIIIDCGKGTTDFSVIQAQENDARIMRPIYRNGFAGAGNLISFGFLESIIHYLKLLGKDNPEIVEKIEKFISSSPRGEMDYTKYELSKILEQWKANYDQSSTREAVEQEWKSIYTGQYDLERSLNEYNANAIFVPLLDIFKKAPTIYDWGGYISKSVETIVQRVYGNLLPVITHLNKTAKCGGILFTGRGFLFKPLELAIKAALGSIRGVHPDMFIDNKHIDLKTVCLQGVFAPNILSYSDIATTPIEVKRGTIQQIKHGDVRKATLMRKVLGFLNKLADSEGEYYSDETNSCSILNLDMINCQFLIGGKIYAPKWAHNTPLEKASIIHTRKGFFVKAFDVNGKLVITSLQRVGDQGNALEAEIAIKKSLFPGWFEPALIGK